MSSSRRPSRTESRVDFEVNQSSHGFSVGSILTHSGSAYAAAINTDEIVGVVSEVDDSNNFTIQTSGRIDGLSSLVAGTQYYVSDSSSGDATSTDTDTPVYIAISTTEAVINTYVESTGGGGSGDLVLVDTQEITSAVSTVDFTSSITATYSSYLFVFEGVQCGTSGANFYVRTSSNNGSSFDTTSYVCEYRYAQAGGAGTGFASSYTGGLELFQNATNSQETFSGQLFLLDPLNSGSYTVMNGQGLFVNGATAYYRINYSGLRTVNEATDAIRFLPSTGTLTSGTIKLYGVK